MIQGLIGKKIDQSQAFLEDGQRVPVTSIVVSGNTVIEVKNKEKHGYEAVKIGFGIKKNANKSEIGQVKGAKLEKAPLLLKEVLYADAAPEAGSVISVSEVFKPGDVIDVIGVSKGKGYAGVVKRHHFRGGPRTHGQSDRERAPGSIGQTTTPGRVYKGKRMAGRMGSDNVTIKNLQVLEVKDDMLLVKGLIPGIRGGLVVIEKVGEGKNFIPLYSDKQEEVKEVQVESKPQEENPSEVQNLPEEVPVEVQSEQKEEGQPQTEVQNSPEVSAEVQPEPARNASQSEAGGVKEGGNENAS